MTGYGQLATNPSSVVHGAAEDAAVAVDMTDLLASLGILIPPSSPTAILTDNNLGGQPVTLADTPTVSSNTISQRIRANVLTAGHTYTLQLIFEAGSPTVLETVTTVVCPI